MTLDYKYKSIIEKGQNAHNDQKHAFIVERLTAMRVTRWLDIGCNAGWLLQDVAGGVGVDASLDMAELAKGKGLTVHHALASQLPFDDLEFEVAVLGSMLHLVPDWKEAIREASRVALAVIGTAEFPGTPWGVIGGPHKSVKSVIDPAEIEAMAGSVEQINESSYFFQL